MKKVLLTAAVAMFAMSANAQNETQRTSDAHNILVNLAVTDMIDLDPEAQTGNGALNSWAAYNNGIVLDEGTTPGFEFTISASREYKMDISATNFGADNDGDFFPASILSWQVTTAPTAHSSTVSEGGDFHWVTPTALSTSSQTFLRKQGGHLMGFECMLYANPQYQYNVDGGTTYTSNITITATLD